jgi:hypothetical protein
VVLSVTRRRKLERVVLFRDSTEAVCRESGAVP